MAQKKTTPRSRKAKIKKITALAVPKERSVDEYIDENNLTSQQALFLRLYYDRESPTWGNAKQSAIAAGFGHEYANQITYKRPEWWLDFVRQQNLIGLIEQHFTEVMTMPTVTQAMGAFGPLFATEKVREQIGVFKNGKPKFKMKTVKTPIMVQSVPLMKVKNEVAKIAAPAHDPSRYGKSKDPKSVFSFNIKLIKNEYA